MDRALDYLDFLATALLDRRVLDLECGSTPEQVEASLGANFIDDMEKRRRYFRRDYGLIELTFVRNAEWVCSNANIQAHRLMRPGSVPAPLEECYGPFPRRVKLSDLVARIAERGHQLVLASRDSDRPYERYATEPAGPAYAFVVGDTSGADNTRPATGELWSISAW